MAATSLAEDRIFELARRLLEEYIAGREEYEPRISWGLFSTSGPHMRRHLHTLTRNDSAVQIFYSQWLAGPEGKATCGISINGHTKPGLELDFHTNPAELDATFTAWLRQTIANAASL